MDLKDKVVVVTGASDGIGKEIALRLAREGAKLALTARTGEKLKEVEESCKEAGSPYVRNYGCDICNSSERKDTVAKIMNDFGGVNVLINMAGVWQKLNLPQDIPEDEIDNVISVNLTGLIQMTRLFIPHLKNGKEAAIINMSSRSGVTAQPGQAIYVASKWGVTGFTEVLKQDLKEDGIRVAGLYPGGISTGLLEKAGDKINRDKYTNPKDIAEVVYFMLTRPPKIWLHDVRIEY